MQIVIDIDEKYYELLKHDVLVNRNDYKPIVLIAKGKPLPAGHGELVDLEKMIEDFWDGNFMEIHKDDLSKIPTVIEADGGAE